jgi:hypothetical protein
VPQGDIRRLISPSPRRDIVRFCWSCTLDQSACMGTGVGSSSNGLSVHAFFLRHTCNSGAGLTETRPSGKVDFSGRSDLLRAQLKLSATQPPGDRETALMEASTLLKPVQNRNIWRVEITWPNAKVNYFGKFASEEDAIRWVSAHGWLTAPPQKTEPWPVVNTDSNLPPVSSAVP